MIRSRYGGEACDFGYDWTIALVNANKIVGETPEFPITNTATIGVFHIVAEDGFCG